jgi:hypothetical protein
MFRIKYEEINGNPAKINREFIGNPIEDFSEMFERFSDAYGIKALIVDDIVHKRRLTPKKERKCRFCKAVYSEKEKFKTKAHLFPKLLGNENLFSDFECDTCNSFFGENENHLANFLGLPRAMTFIKGKRSKLKFESPDETLIIKRDPNEYETPKFIIESYGEENNHVSIDDANKKITIHTVRHSYNPLKVYKAFLKMGISILPQHYIDDYEIAIAILNSKKKNEELNNPFFKMDMYFHPGPAFPSPLAILFEKRDKKQAFPMHIFCLMFHNYTYQLVLPLNNQDKWMYDGKITVTVPNMPPFIDKHFAEVFGKPIRHRLNFNFDDLKKNEKHDISFSFQQYTDKSLLET